jgi:DNA-binding NtrC family response regulator
MNEPGRSPWSVEADRRIVKILVFDDNDVDRLALRRGLQQSGVEVSMREVESTSEAGECIQRGECDCVFVGDSIAHTQLFTLLLRIHEAAFDVPVVITTYGGDGGGTIGKAGTIEFLSTASLTPVRLAAICRQAFEISNARE